MIKTLGTVFLAFTLMLFAADAKAATSTDETDIIGTILEVEGSASVTQLGGQPQPATVNMPVHIGDTLETSANSKLYVMLIDSTELTLSENGLMNLDDYYFDDTDNTDNKATYSVAKGAFLYVSGLVAKKEKPDVTVNVPSGSIGIRGTRFWGGELDGEYGVLVGDGIVEVDTGGGKARLKKGEGTTLRGRGVAPDPVKTWGKKKIDRAVGTVSLKQPGVVGQRIATEKRERQQYLRERHKKLQHDKLEKIRSEIEKEKPDLKGKLTKSDLLKIERERMTAAKIPDEEIRPRKLTDSKMKPIVDSKGNTAREAIRTKAEDKREALRDKADATREAIREKAEATREAAGNIAKPAAEKVIEPVTSTVTKTTEPVTSTVTKTIEPVAPKIAPVLKDPLKQ